MTKIGVFGASGFVGATLVERLLAQQYCEVRPFIHNSGRAWRLARHGVQLRSVDLLCEDEVRKAVEGCTHIVNCSRGPAKVMIGGLKTLIRSCLRGNVERFVHLSSTAVYGEPPPPEGAREDALARPAAGTYGWVKLRQDEMVARGCQEGLPSVILCPPNISGPYSSYLLSMIDAIREGKMALVDGGEVPCNLVDVRNLAKAIELALFAGKANATRIFVTDDEDITWRHVIEPLVPLADCKMPVPSITGEQALRLIRSQTSQRISILQSMRHLFSRDVRSVLLKDPFFSKIDQSLRGLVQRFPKGLEDRTRTWLSQPKLNGHRPQYVFDHRFLLHQLRSVKHTCDKAKQELGYAPEITFSSSMQSFRSWYQATHGWGSDFWPLARQLYSLGHETAGEMFSQ